jgi:hypothetical protein
MTAFEKVACSELLQAADLVAMSAVHNLKADRGVVVMVDRSAVEWVVW